MAQVTVNIPLDEDLHWQFDSLCNDLGMDVVTAVRVFVKSTIRHGGIPFELTADEPDPFYSPANIQRLKRSIANLEAGGGTYHELSGTHYRDK